jgi:hypothetical protein
MDEIWKDIPNYEGLYQVSNLGRVKSVSRRMWSGSVYYTSKERILKNQLGSSGYYKVNLNKNGIKTNHNIHVLVGMAFHDHVPNGYDDLIDHINENKLDNRAENLQITDQSHNMRKTYSLKKSKRKSTNPSL